MAVPPPMFADGFLFFFFFSRVPVGWRSFWAALAFFTRSFADRLARLM